MDAIFDHDVLNGHVTFRTEPWTMEERGAWFRRYDRKRYHVLVGQIADRVVGCAYSSRYRAAGPFETAVETSIYLDHPRRRKGLGTALYPALLEPLASRDVHVAVAGIALPNDASIALHRRLGFEQVGVFREYARKNGTWISSVWFQRFIGPAS
ncbi:N-acetyltransferase family protein [Roseomonas sp. OT10]|nr:N-acetyltransferase family protein [Roseomonas sp. OT10]